MKRYIIIFMLALTALVSCNKRETSGELPMFWTWMEDREGLDLDSLFVHMDEAGIDGLMLYVPDTERYQKAAALAKEHGVTLYAWVWTLNPRGDRQTLLETHPDWFDVNRDGKSLAPAMTVNDEVYAKMTPEKALALIDELRAKEAASNG